MARQFGRSAIKGVALAAAVLLLSTVLAKGAGAASAGSPAAATGTQSAATPTLVGANSSDWVWFDNAIGPLPVYRSFDIGGFHYATWQDTAAYAQHPTAPGFDYSFDILPQRLTDPADPINSAIQSFLATTPKNLMITDYHEPDNTVGLFTPAQFRAGILSLANMVRAQNALDGGTRVTSVILMDVTFGGTWNTQPIDWWPTDARDGGHVDLIEGDMYEWPHATNTPGVPVGYTDGIKWRTATQLLSPLRNFAAANNTPWAIAELGILEDVNDPNRKATELANAVAYANANGALHILYFDNFGSRANWRLRYASPPGTTSSTSNAAMKWKDLVAASTAPPAAPAPTTEWVLNQGFDGGSTTGWTNPYNTASKLAAAQVAGNWMMSVGNAATASQDVGVCNRSPYWVNNATAAATVYTATAQAMPTLSGQQVRLVVKETTPGGAQVAYAQTSAVALTNTAALTQLPKVSLTAVGSGDSIRVCLLALAVPATRTFYADNFSLSSPA